MIYANPDTVMVEGHNGTLDPALARYRVRWMDLQGHVHQTPQTLLWGEAYLLADKLEHGEPYVPTVH